MRARLPVITFVVVACSVSAASKPIQVSVHELLARPQQFHGKRADVIGFLDSSDRGWDLRSSQKHVPVPQGPIDNTIYIDCLDWKGQPTIGKRDFLKHYVHVIGRFEYCPRTPDVQKGAFTTIWVGFGYGHTCQITAITLFKSI